VIRARMWVCVFSCLPILAGIPAADAHSVYTVLALICFALWGYASWSTMGLTLPSDLFPQDVVATVTGLSGLAAGLVDAVFTMSVGFLVDRFSFGSAFMVAGLLPLFATACLLLLVRAPPHCTGIIDSEGSPASSRPVPPQSRGQDKRSHQDGCEGLLLDI